MWFNKYYRCSECGELWQDEWDCLCNDRCPVCDTECEPYDHAEIDEESMTLDDKSRAVAKRHGNGENQTIGFIMIIPRRLLDESPETKTLEG